MGEALVMSYFTVASESLHLAISRDGVEWTPVFQGASVLRGGVGERTLRDPFIGIGLDGKYHLLATNGWSSRSIVHAWSDDLIEWSEQELVPVMEAVDSAQNAWAPEFFVDIENNTHHVIWSSSVRGEAAAWDALGETHETTMDHRIWSSSTPDFESWSGATVFFDPGYTVIDASVRRCDDGYLMAYKDERGTNEDRGEFKGIRTVTFKGVGESFSPPSQIITGPPAEGPTLFQTAGGLVMMFDQFLDGTYGALTTTDRVQWTPVVGFMPPPGARHGAVVQVPEHDLLRLERALLGTSRRKPTTRVSE
jgi:hypothetical protein